MRRLADALGVLPNALYSYFPDKASILDAVLDDLIGDVERPDPNASPRRGLVSLMTSYRSLLLTQPRLIALTVSRPQIGPKAIRLREDGLTLLKRGGLSDADAVRAYLALFAYTAGFVAFEAGGPPANGTPSSAPMHETFMRACRPTSSRPPARWQGAWPNARATPSSPTGSSACSTASPSPALQPRHSVGRRRAALGQRVVDLGQALGLARRFRRSLFLVPMRFERPGYAEVTEVLAKRGVNLLVTGVASRGRGVAAFVCDDEDGARSALREAEIDDREIPALQVHMEDRPGEAAQISRKLADAGVNVEFWMPVESIWASFLAGVGGSGEAFTVAVGVDDPMRPGAALGKRVASAPARSVSRGAWLGLSSRASCDPAHGNSLRPRPAARRSLA
jgi:AcrR family transcriptional regulator